MCVCVCVCVKRVCVCVCPSALRTDSLDTKSGAHVLLGGDYWRLERRVGDALEGLRARGLHVVVYWDGDERRLKRACGASRAAQRCEEWAALELWATTAADLRAPAEQPVPVLALRATRAAVCRCAVEQVQCAGEADQALAAAARCPLSLPLFTTVHAQLFHTHTHTHTHTPTGERARLKEFSVPLLSFHFACFAS